MLGLGETGLDNLEVLPIPIELKKDEEAWVEEEPDAEDEVVIDNEFDGVRLLELPTKLEGEEDEEVNAAEELDCEVPVELTEEELADSLMFKGVMELELDDVVGSIDGNCVTVEGLDIVEDGVLEGDRPDELDGIVETEPFALGEEVELPKLLEEPTGE